MVPVLLFGVLADQASKTWASARAVEPRVLVPGYLVAYSVPNAGMILGHGKDHPLASTIFALIGVALAARLVKIVHADRWRWRGSDWLACGLLLAGMFGNTLDRLALGHVRDFLVSRAAPNLVFNVADVLVAIGLAGLLLARFRSDRAGHAEVAIG
jgi:lipoprotein signal peptidase